VANLDSDTPELSIGQHRAEAAREEDIPAISALNNAFAPQGLTLMRSQEFVENHLADYRVVRGHDGTLLGCAALDDYSPSLAELVSLAVQPEAQGQGIGRVLMDAIEDLARRRGYPEIFAVSFSERLFLGAGYSASSIVQYPEKEARYRSIDRSEITVARKYCFTRRLDDSVR
jgi:N-acetylglutamate synthase-like GNAT family acetyltransferase